MRLRTLVATAPAFARRSYDHREVFGQVGEGEAAVLPGSFRFHRGQQSLLQGGCLAIGEARALVARRGRLGFRTALPGDLRPRNALLGRLEPEDGAACAVPPVVPFRALCCCGESPV